jgi:hypothetical protein
MLRALFVAVVAQVGSIEGPIYSSPSRPAVSTSNPVVFNFLTDTTGAPVLGDLCAQLTVGEWTGDQKFCMNADGTFRSGSVSFSASGGVTSSARRVCNNGLDCDSQTEQRFDGTDDYYASAATASPVGSFSVGCVLSQDAAGTAMTYLSHWNATGSTDAWILDLNTSSTPRLVTTDGTSTVASGPAILAGRAYQYVGATYTHVGAGAVNSATVYVNSTAGTTSSVMRPPRALATEPMQIGHRVNGTNNFAGYLRGCFLVEVALTGARHAEIAAAAVGVLTGKAGEAVTVTRSTTTSIVSADTSIVGWAPISRPAVGAGGLQAWPSTTNLILRSEEFDNAAWVKAGNVVAAPTVNANAALSPDGLLTADELVFPAVANAGEYSRVSQAITAASAVRSASLWLRRASGTSTLYLYLLDDLGAYHSAACAVTTTWTRCKLEGVTTGANPSMFLGVDLTAGSDQAAQGAQTIYAWGAGFHTASMASPYIVTAGAQVTRNADLVDAAGTFAVGTGPWCVAATVILASWPPASDESYATAVYTAATNRRALLVNPDGTVSLYQQGTSTNDVTTSVATVPVGVATRLKAWSNGNSDARVCVGATCVHDTTHAFPAGLASSYSAVRLAYNPNTNTRQVRGTVYGITYANTSGGCD